MDFNLGRSIGWLFDFTFYYPLFMSYVWMCGGLYYYFHYERKDPAYDQPPPLPSYPVSLDRSRGTPGMRTRSAYRTATPT